MTGWDSWVAVPPAQVTLEPAGRKLGVAADLEVAFDASAGDWLSIGRALGAEASAELAHAPACVSNASDLGQMLAWARLIQEWAKAASVTLVVCDDPWLFRHCA